MLVRPLAPSRAAALGLAVALVTVSASAATVTGRVHRGGEPLADAVVWVELDSTPGPGELHVVDQRDMRFVPSLTVARVGDRARFLNSDTEVHSVQSFSPEAPFNIAVRPGGESPVVELAAAAVVRLRCAYHGQMAATLLVLPPGRHATTDADGRFVLEGVPDAIDALGVWHPTVGRTVGPREPGASELDLDLAPPR